MNSQKVATTFLNGSTWPVFQILIALILCNKYAVLHKKVCFLCNRDCKLHKKLYQCQDGKAGSGQPYRMCRRTELQPSCHRDEQRGTHYRERWV